MQIYPAQPARPIKPRLTATSRQDMKISISIQHDTENSYPTATVDFWPSDERVTIKFSDSDREVSVLTSDLLKLAASIHA